MPALATQIARRMLDVDECRFLAAIDQKNKALQSAILALPNVSRIFVRYRAAVRTGHSCRSDPRAAGSFGRNARISPHPVLPAQKYRRAFQREFRLESRSTFQEAG
jgi:hypothetical protein